MLLATILLLGALPQSLELARSAANVAAASVADAAEAKDSSAVDSSAVRELPSMPKPKVDSDAGADGVTANVALAIQPVKPAYTRPRETRGQRVAWYTLVAAGHGAAAFDAYSTRLVVGGNYGMETNPLLRPFSHSGAMYAATQVSPAVMDYIGKRMMVSENRWVRRLWWLPQAAGSGFSVAAGVHNLGVAR